jgi:hypothetical protein
LSVLGKDAPGTMAQVSLGGQSARRSGNAEQCRPGHSNIKMTGRYAKLARQHIAKNGSTAREIWKLMN